MDDILRFDFPNSQLLNEDENNRPISPDPFVSELTCILDVWIAESDNPSFDPLPTVQRVADLIERATEEHLKQDPDPFDDRHPSRADPSSTLGQLLKTVKKYEEFVNKLVITYLSNTFQYAELRLHSARLLLDILPGLDANVIFTEYQEELIGLMYDWANNGEEPLCWYAVALLAFVIELPDLVGSARDRNTTLVPVMLRQLAALREQMMNGPDAELLPSILPSTSSAANLNVENDVRFAINFEDTDLLPDSNRKLKFTQITQSNLVPDFNCNNNDSRMVTKIQINASHGSSEAPLIVSTPAVSRNHLSSIRVSVKRKLDDSGVLPSDDCSSTANCLKQQMYPSSKRLRRASSTNDVSNSSWADLEPFIIGQHRMYPLTVNMKQRFILQYLTAVGEYQELLSFAYDFKVWDHIAYYIDLKKNNDVRLAFDALRYLASLLCHRKFCLEQVNAGIVQRLLAVPRVSVASAGVALCLYYLAYSEDVIEKVCQLPISTVEEMVCYALWLLEHSYESGKCHATMFFTCAFSCRIVLDLFDQNDGLRKLYNVISTLSILQTEDMEMHILTEDQIYTSRNAVRDVSQALTKYFESHLLLKLEQMRRQHPRLIVQGRNIHVPSFPSWKVCKVDMQTLEDCVALLIECLPLHATWKPIDDLRKLGGIILMLQVAAFASDWNYNGRTETMVYALTTLWYCSVIPQLQLDLCEVVKLQDNAQTAAMSILLGLCEGEMVNDCEVQRAALRVVINCVCGPETKFGGVRCASGGSPKKMVNMTACDILQKMWECVRQNNGIMVLRNLVFIKSPITDADSIRAMACRALDGLARCSIIKQIISKMPLITSNQLLLLTQEPVLQDRRTEHLRFCSHAQSLIHRVTGRRAGKLSDSWDIDKLYRASIVAQTKIVYNEKELLQLIHHHLQSIGLAKTANVLKKEATLPTYPAGDAPPIPLSLRALPRRLRDSFLSEDSVYNQSSVSSHYIGGITSFLNNFRNVSGANEIDSMRIPAYTRRVLNFDNQSSNYNASNGSGAIRFHVATTRSGFHGHSFNRPLPFNQKQPQYLLSQGLQNNVLLNKRVSDKPVKPVMSLDSIVQEYFRKQHALCSNPVVTCPPFSLFYPHQCPDPKLQQAAPYNITSRFYQRSAFPVGGGYDGVRCDYRYVFSKFKPAKVFKDQEENEVFTCCSFMPGESSLLLGTYAGDLKWFNIDSGLEVKSFSCHASSLIHVETTKDGRCFLTSSAFVKPYSAFWRLEHDQLVSKYQFHDDNYAEFSKFPEDKIVGTRGEEAYIYDVVTGNSVRRLFDAEIANHYTRNRATFHPSQDLVLSDGILWDINSGSVVHKFDKLNPHLSGVFHPRGTEVLINMEVWDIRTFHLLHTVPALDQCKVIFNGSSDIIYGAVNQIAEDQDFDETRIRTTLASSFRTFDATDYSLIATTDVKRNILDLCTDKLDTYLAIIENQGHVEDLLSLEENVCRLYEVGKQRTVEEEGDEADDGDDDGEDDDDEISLDEDDVPELDIEDAEVDTGEENEPALGEEEEDDDDSFQPDSDNEVLSDSSNSVSSGSEFVLDEYDR